MNLRNPLETLDELILAQHEKVTQAAHKKLGWNKYDLARATGYLLGGTFSGAGMYNLSVGVTYHEPLITTLSALAALGGLGGAYFCNRLTELGERIELQDLVNTGARSNTRDSDLSRLAFAAAGLAFLAFGGNTLAGHTDIFPSEPLSTLAGLTASCAGLSQLGMGLHLYFLDCTMTPPSTKKSLWKAAYQKITGLLQPPPEPVKIPVRCD